MKLLVFAHTPPPHHGQSYMVQLMLEGFGGDRRAATAGGVSPPPHGIDCYHVNARVSKKLEDIGDFRFTKFLLLLGYCLQAIWCRFRYGVENLYYIPAPGKRSALYRDWLVMFLCRPFFKRLILHWHAAGLAKWLETCVQIRARSTTYRALKNADLSIVLSHYNRADAEKLYPQKIEVVGNGIADPCPNFDTEGLPSRRMRRELRARAMARENIADQSATDQRGIHVVRILYLAHCMREKGLFDAIEGVITTNRRLAAQDVPVQLHLMIAGNFVTDAEKAEFDQILTGPEAAEAVRYLGFVSGERKNQLLQDADLFLFPTFYQNENQPVNLIEAMAFGLPIVTTRWRSLPEMFPPDYAGLVEIRSPDQIAHAMLQLLPTETGERFRSLFREQFTVNNYLTRLAETFRNVEA